LWRAKSIAPLAEDPMTPPDTGTRISPIPIVFADNDNLILEIIGELLRSKGFELHLAHDGLEALQVIRSVKPKCVILDVVMPKLDGSRVCWLIRQDPALRETPIIVFSSLSAQDFRHFPDLSADAYVAKGAITVAFENLMQAIEHLQMKGRTDVTGSIFGYDQVRPQEIVGEVLRERRHYANLLRALGPGIVELDRNGRIIMINGGACEILEKNEGQLVGEPIATLCSPQDKGLLEDLLRELTEAVEPERGRVVVRFGDLEVPLQLCAILEDGRCTGVLLIMESKVVGLTAQNE
jgi:CheY-like chemotaxis protein